MAGVGFELKKLFDQKESYVSTVKGYAATTIVTQGPMFLSILMMLGLKGLLVEEGILYGKQEVFLMTLTYIMLFSIVITSPFLLLITRYISDCIYQHKSNQIIDAFYGVCSMTLIIGSALSICFLSKLEIRWLYKALVFIQFGVVTIMWIQMALISALKNYRQILKGFCIAGVISIIIGKLGILFGMDPLMSVLLGSTLGYITMAILFMIAIIQFYPAGEGKPFKFLMSIDEHKELVWIGIFLTIGLYGHHFIMWIGEYGTTILGSMRYCMLYDVPALFACLSITPMMVLFIVSLEVKFYSSYRIYFDKIKNGGKLEELQYLEDVMKKTLLHEITHMLEVQMVCSLFAITFMARLLSMIGLDVEMMGIFRILCIGYLLYGLGRSLTIILLYFDDKKGAILPSALFMLTNLFFTFISLKGGLEYYGLGFLGAALCMVIAALLRLKYYLDHLEEYIFCKQPIIPSHKKGFFTKLIEGNKMSGAYESEL